MKKIVIGRIRTTWGVRGWLKLHSYSGEWKHFAALSSLQLRGGKRPRNFQVEGFRMHSGYGMIKLAGIDTPEAGKALAGMEIAVPREQAAPLGDNEWYLSDLTGMAVCCPDGTVTGRITGIIESSDDLLEVEKPDGRRFLVPFRSEFVQEPDFDSRSVVLTALWVADDQ